jgi:hypothetical protein
MSDLWTPERPIRELPEEISDIFVDKSRFLYQDLQEHRLKVVLIPAPEPHFEGHCIRCVEDRNPQWYRDLYHGHPNWQRKRTKRALERIANHKDLQFMKGPIGCVEYKYHYDTELRRLIYDILISGYYENMGRHTIVHSEPNKDVRDFFGHINLTEQEFYSAIGIEIDDESNQIPF